ncbi:MAG: hypothetical protein ACTTJW_08420 [Sphaerochaeta sp.]
MTEVKTLSSLLIILTAVPLLFCSCRTVKYDMGVQYKTTETEAVKEEQSPAPENILQWTVGETGPEGGLVFECGGRFPETGEELYEVQSFDKAVAYCSTLSEKKGVLFRLPTIEELKAVYNQLIETELSDIEWTYYWSSETFDELSIKVINFDTGFEGVFYREMDFLSVLPVTEL